jgi:hypothetical protein
VGSLFRLCLDRRPSRLVNRADQFKMASMVIASITSCFLLTGPCPDFRAANMTANLPRESGAFGIIPVCQGGAVLPQRISRLLLA